MLESMGLNITQNGHDMNKELAQIFVSILVVYLNTIISLLGIGGNAMNIKVIAKQGFGDGFKISLFVLAIADTGALLTSLFISLCYNPAFVNADLAVDLQDLQSIVASFTRGMFTRLASSVTAFITLERCLCVVLPLRFKEIISSRVTAIVMIAIFMAMAFTLVPFYFYCGLGWKYDTKRNRTVLGLVMFSCTENADVKGTIAVHTFVQIASYCVISIFTIILLVKLKQQSQWRHMLPGNSKRATDRANRKLNKTLALVTTLALFYLVCYAPGIAMLMVNLAIEEFYIYGGLANYFMVVITFCLLLENINSSVTLLLYYSMSANYRKSFRAIVCIKAQR